MNKQQAKPIIAAQVQNPRIRVQSAEQFDEYLFLFYSKLKNSKMFSAEIYLLYSKKQHVDDIDTFL